MEEEWVKVITLHSYVFNANTSNSLSSYYLCLVFLPLRIASPSCPSLLPHPPAPASSLSLMPLPTASSHCPSLLLLPIAPLPCPPSQPETYLRPVTWKFKECRALHSSRRRN